MQCSFPRASLVLIIWNKEKRKRIYKKWKGEKVSEQIFSFVSLLLDDIFWTFEVQWKRKPQITSNFFHPGK